MWDVFFLLLFFTPLLVAGILRHRREMRELHKEALEQFSESRIEVDDPRWCFSGASASIIHEAVEWARFEGTTHYFLTIYATNQLGEYFIFRTNYDKPIIKHIDHKVASAILQSKYKSPNPSINTDAAR